MPNERTLQTLYIGRDIGGIERMNVASLYKPAELGGRLAVAKKAYQLVQLDSGATAATNAGVVAAGDLAFWKDRSNYLVTNDKDQAVGGPTVANARNSVCGVFTFAATAGRYCVVQQRGRRSVRTDGGGDFDVGDFIVASSNNVADGDVTDIGTSPPVTKVGEVAAAEAAGFTACELDLPVDTP
jgi:hypothetical protein